MTTLKLLYRSFLTPTWSPAFILLLAGVYRIETAYGTLPALAVGLPAGAGLVLLEVLVARSEP